MSYGYRKNALCPMCGEIYSGYPALSRRDNKTEICSHCGEQEAMADFMGMPYPPLRYKEGKE